MNQFRPRSISLACECRNTVSYAAPEVWRRTISRQIEQLFQQAQTYLQTGEAESAEAVCAGALDEYPEDANFLCLSARALLKLERFNEANARIDRALSIFPEFERAYEVRGDLQLAKGELPAAAESFELALKFDPKLQRTRMKLRQVFMRMGRVEEARALRSEFMEFSQDNKDIAKAAEFEKEEKFAEAEKLYRQILTRAPDNVSAMRLWAGLGIREKRYAAAEVLLQRAVKKAPDFSKAWADLVTVQHEQDKFDAAIESAKRLVKLDPRALNGHLSLASACASAGRHQDALKSFNAALELAPDHVRVLCGKGNLCRTIGDQDGAIAAFRKSIKANPMFAEPYWSLANLKTVRFRDSEVDDMLALIGDERIPAEGQVQLNNALGLEFDGRKEYDRAFEFIDRCNKLRREQEFYDSVENQLKTNYLTEVFTQQFLENKMGHGNPEPAPIFIVGLPRSGSTLIEQILSSHSKVDGTHELRDLALTIRSISKMRGSGAPYPKT